MTRSDTLAFSRLALLTTFFAASIVAFGQESARSAEVDSGWEAQGTVEHQPSFRRADSSTTDWRPTRTGPAEPQDESAVQSAPPKNWLPPTQAAGRAKAATKAKPSSQTAPPTLRAPKPFVPPADAQQLAAAPKPVARNAESAALVVAKSQSGTNVNKTAAQVRQPGARDSVNQAQSGRVAPRSPRERVAYRPRPTSTSGTQSFADNWIRPLKQVAYQAAEAEELYAPPGKIPQMPMPGDEATGPEIPSDGEWIGSPDGSYYDGGYGPTCNDGVGCCSTCGNCEPDSLDLCTIGPHDDESCDSLRIRIPKFQELMVFGGVHGFKGPYDRNRDGGNFGFQEGFNVGAKLPFLDAGYQFGYEATQSQLSGDANTGVGSYFTQHFYTGGVFHRTRDGFQGGIVWDVLADERDTSVTFSQLRAELGFVDCGCHEVGVTGAVHLKDHRFVETNDNETTTITTFQSVDQFLLYYRMHGERGGEGRIYGGLTDNADGIIGSDFLLPLTDCWSLQPAFTYLIPNTSTNEVAARQEAWNISIALVWHWRGHARACHSSPYRPLFNVADNGYMIIDNRP